MAKCLLSLVVLAAVFANSSALLCYVSRSPAGTNGTSVSCTATSVSCFSIVTTTGVQGAICGTTCTSGSAASCYSCNTDLCNTVSPSSITCYSRSSSSDTGVQSACPTGITACFTSTSGTAGCGTCASTTDCTNCNTNLCNTASSTTTASSTATASSTISCYTNAGVGSFSLTTTSIGCSSCFVYSTSVAGVTAYTSGCGTCAAYASYGNCRACTTSLCNTSSGSTVRASLTAAAAGIAVLMLMKLF